MRGDTTGGSSGLLGYRGLCVAVVVLHDGGVEDPETDEVPQTSEPAEAPRHNGYMTPRAQRKERNRLEFAKHAAKVRELQGKLLATKVPVEPEKNVLDALILYQERLYRQSIARILDDSAIQDTVKRLKLLAACAQPLKNCQDIQALTDAISAVEPLIHGLRKQASKSDTSSHEVDFDLAKAANELKSVKV